MGQIQFCQGFLTPNDPRTEIPQISTGFGRKEGQLVFEKGRRLVQGMQLAAKIKVKFPYGNTEETDIKSLEKVSRQVTEFQVLKRV